ncbi:MAG: DUF2877 domain-containing protein [Thermomicrobiales bacterium]|nr:DUF2877 domain-containing protein [Thermomicrobiales bacterium]
MNGEPWQGWVTASLQDHLGSSGTGRVHSIFRQSFNIDVDGLLLNVGQHRQRLSPLGMALEPSSFGSLWQDVAVGDLVRWSARKFAIYPTRGAAVAVPWERMVPIDHSVPSGGMAPEVLPELAVSIRKLDLDARIGLALDDEMRRVVANLTQHEATEAERRSAISWLLGRGRGLTPSGDDIVAGYAFVLWMCGIAILDARLREDARQKTTATSATLLHMLSFGETGQALFDVWRAVSEEGSPHLDRALVRVLEIGHTSGSDTVFGIGMGVDRMLATQSLGE